MPEKDPLSNTPPPADEKDLRINPDSEADRLKVSKEQIDKREELPYTSTGDNGPPPAPDEKKETGTGKEGDKPAGDDVDPDLKKELEKHKHDFEGLSEGQILEARIWLAIFDNTIGNTSSFFTQYSADRYKRFPQDKEVIRVLLASVIRKYAIQLPLVGLLIHAVSVEYLPTVRQVIVDVKEKRRGRQDQEKSNEGDERKPETAIARKET